MQLHQLKPNHKSKRARRIGRGGKKGFTAGRGSKGQKARAGRLFKPIIKELIKRYPKLRGHRAKVLKKAVVSCNLDLIEHNFKTGETVNFKSLTDKRIVEWQGQKTPRVKILGQGKLTKPLVFQDCFFSKSAKEKAEKAGAKIVNQNIDSN